MSQSPLQPNQVVDDEYRLAWEALFEMLYTGASLSGRERNCCYINRGELPFVDVSAVAGLNFPDDGRALALTDWDGDGALDLWAMNRSAPRARLLRNQATAGNHFLTLELQGTTSNRDAIGARVEWYPHDSDTPAGSTTVRAGEGYLAQSTKRVHFGLGTISQVNRVVVRWPGGQPEEFTDLEVDRAYRLVQGSGAAEALSRPTPSLLPAGKAVPAAPTDAARIVLAERVPMPRLYFADFTGERWPLALDDRPMLVNFWASWCRPCLVELNTWNENANTLRDYDVRIFALSVDEPASHPIAEQLINEQMKWRFDAGIAPPDLVDATYRMLRGVLNDKGPMPVPTSFLVDRKGRLACIYKGPVEHDTLLQDLAMLDANDEAIYESALPFAGVWIHRPSAGSLTQLAIANEFIKIGNTELGDRYLQPLVASAERTGLELPEAGQLSLAGAQLNVGVKLAEEGRTRQAVAALRRALELKPDYAKAHFNLGIALESAGDLASAIDHYRQASELDPAHAEAHFNLGHALFATGDRQAAIRAYQQAVSARPRFADAQYNLGHALLASGQHDEAASHLQEVIRLQATRAEAHFNLANSFMLGGHIEQALASYRRAVELRGDHAPWRYNLGVALARSGDNRAAQGEFRTAAQLDSGYTAAWNGLARSLVGQTQLNDAEIREALAAAERAAELTGRQNVGVLDTLAAAHASAGDFAKAIEIVENVLSQSAGQLTEQVASQLTQRLAAYRQGRRDVP